MKNKNFQATVKGSFDARGPWWLGVRKVKGKNNHGGTRRRSARKGAKGQRTRREEGRRIFTTNHTNNIELHS